MQNVEVLWEPHSDDGNAHDVINADHCGVPRAVDIVDSLSS